MKKYWPLGLLVTTLIWGSFFSTLLHAKIFFFQFWVGLGLLVYAKDELKVTKLSISLVVLLIFAALSSLWATDLTLAWTGQFWRGTGLFFYFSLLLSLLLLQSTQDKGLGEKLSFATGVVSVVISSCLIIDTLFIRKESGSIIFTGNPNATGAYLSFAFFIIYRFRESFNKKFKHLSVILLVLTFLSVFLTGSRSSLGGLVLGALLLAIFENKKILKSMVVSCSAVTMIAVIYHFLIDPKLFLNMFARAENFHRIEIWSGAFKAFLDKFLFGWGFHGLYEGFWNNFPGKLSGKFQWIDNAHSLFLNVLAELGVVGILILSVSMFFIAKEILNRETKDQKYWVIFFLNILIYMTFQPVYIDTLVLTLVSLTLLFISSKDTTNYVLDLEVGKYLKTILGIGLIILTSIQLKQSHLVEDTRSALSTGRDYRPIWRKYQSTVPLLDKTGALYRLSNQFNLLVNDRSLSSSDKIIFKKLILNEFNKLEEVNAHRPRFIELHGIWLMRNKQFEKADMKFDLLLSKSPNIINIINLKGELKAITGNKFSAIELFEKSDSLEDRLSTKMNLAKLYADVGLKDKSKLKLKEALKLSPENKQIKQILDQFK